MYDLGIIGGMGSRATEVLFRKILDATDAVSDQEFADIVVLNKASIPDRSAYLLGLSKENPLEALSLAVSELNMLRVGNIAIPCNTSHAFYQELQEVSACSIINMVKTTLEYIDLRNKKQRGLRTSETTTEQEKSGDLSLQTVEEFQTAGTYRKVCVLGTLGTVKLGVYSRYAVRDLEIVYPDDGLCEAVHRLIYDVKNDDVGKMKGYTDRLIRIMKEITDKEGAMTFLLACTELSVLYTQDLKDYDVVDAMDILALVSVAASSKRLKESADFDYEIIRRIAEEYAVRGEQE